MQLATLFHSVHGPRTGTAASDGTFPYLGELPNGGKPADEVVGLLAQEMEHLILETQMRADGGPLKSAVENAVERRKREAGRVGLGLGKRPSAQGPWVQQNGNGNGNGNGSALPVGAASPPVWKERVLGYVRGRSRSLG